MKRAGLWLLGAVGAFYLTFVILGAVVPGSTRVFADDPKTADVLLIGGPIHYDFLLPLNDTTRARLGWLADAGVEMDHPAARWLVVGWGARGFYTTTGDYTDVRAGVVWRGLTGDASVMRVDLTGLLAPQIPRLNVSLSDAQYAALLDHIEASFAHGRATPALELAGLTEFDRFFAAKGRFNITNTCNVWIGESLRAAGLRFGGWTPLPQTVRLSHWLYH